MYQRVQLDQRRKQQLSSGRRISHVAVRTSSRDSAGNSGIVGNAEGCVHPGSSHGEREGERMQIC